MLSSLEIIAFKKFFWQPNWTRLRPRPNWAVLRIFFPSNYFQIGQHIVVLRTLIIKVIIMKTEITIIIMSISSV